MSPLSIKWYLKMGKKHTFTSWWAMHNFFLCVCQNTKTVLVKLHKSWVSVLSLQLPTDCWVNFWIIETEKQGSAIFVEAFKKGISTCQWPNQKTSRDTNWKRKNHERITGKAYIRNACSTKVIPQLSSSTISHYCQLPESYLKEWAPWLTTTVSLNNLNFID